VGAEEVAELRGIKAPRKNISEVRFVAQAKAVIEAAREHLEALGKLGLTAGLIEEASRTLAEFEAISVEAKVAYRNRVSATKALRALEVEIHASIRRLDRLNQHRFAKQPEVLAEWAVIRNVIGPAVRSKEEPKPETPPSGSGGETKAA